MLDCSLKNGEAKTTAFNIQLCRSYSDDMKQTDIEKFKQKLLLQRREIQQLESTLKQSSQTVTLDQSKVGRLSRMDAMQGQQMALEASRRRQLQLHKIKHALNRVENGEFGYCVKCGEEIDHRRLDFDPANSHCIECAEKM